jgi:hypothetical protein
MLVSMICLQSEETAERTAEQNGFANNLLLDTDINTTLMEVSSCIKFSIASLEKDAKLTKYSELAMRNLSKSVDNFRNSCNSMHTFLSKKMEDSIHKREVAHDPYQTPPQRKYMHADEFGDWKNNTANIQECLLRCTDLVPVCLRLLTDKVSVFRSSDHCQAKLCS